MEVPPNLVPREEPHEIKEFKSNYTMTWLAYLVRHGFVNAAIEPNLLKVCARLNRKHDLFVP